MIIRDAWDNYSWEDKIFHNRICAEMLQGEKFFLSPQFSKLCSVVLKINNGDDARIRGSRHFPFYLEVFLTVHLSIILLTDQLNVPILVL